MQAKHKAAKSAAKVDTEAQKKKQVSRPLPLPHGNDATLSPPPPPAADPDFESLEQLELDEPDVVKTNPMLYGAEDDEKFADAADAVHPTGDGGSAGDDFEIEATTRTTLGEKKYLTKKARKAADKASKKAEKQAQKTEKKKTTKGKGKGKGKGKVMETEYHSSNHSDATASDVTADNSLADAAME
jgi:ABC-type Fe3+-hydroxamate transport system substrate-binding protein